MELKYPRQCTWCGQLADRFGQFTIASRVQRKEAEQTTCPTCAARIRAELHRWSDARPHRAA